MLSRKYVTEFAPVVLICKVTKCKSTQFAQIHGRSVASVVGKHSSATSQLCYVNTGVSSCFLAGKLFIDVLPSRPLPWCPLVLTMASRSETLGVGASTTPSAYFPVHRLNEPWGG